MTDSGRSERVSRPSASSSSGSRCWPVMRLPRSAASSPGVRKQPADFIERVTIVLDALDEADQAHHRTAGSGSTASAAAPPGGAASPSRGFSGSRPIRACSPPKRSRCRCTVRSDRMHVRSGFGHFRNLRSDVLPCQALHRSSRDAAQALGGPRRRRAAALQVHQQRTQRVTCPQVPVASSPSDLEELPSMAHGRRSTKYRSDAIAPMGGN